MLSLGSPTVFAYIADARRGPISPQLCTLLAAWNQTLHRYVLDARLASRFAFRGAWNWDPVVQNYAGFAARRFLPMARISA